MPKGKVIDVRPKKRKHNHKPDEPPSPSVGADRPKRIPDHIQHQSDRIRLTKSKNRGHSDRCLALDFPFSGKLQKRIFVGSLVLGILAAFIGVLVHQISSWHQSQLVKTPINLPTVIPKDRTPDELFWGSYRPGFYFGMRYRRPHSLLVGLIWTVQDPQNPKFRHTCDLNDGVLSYNWLEHDGRNFGTQQIVDTQHIITVSFMKHLVAGTGNDWTVRISAVARNLTQPAKPLSLIVYFYYPDASQEYAFVPTVEGQAATSITGHTVDLGEHEIIFHPTSDRIQLSSLICKIPSEDMILRTMLNGMGFRRDTGHMSLVGHVGTMDKEEISNAWFYEITVNPPVMSHEFDTTQTGKTALEVQFIQLGQTTDPVVGKRFDNELASLSARFHRKFIDRFPVDATKFTERQVNLSKIAVSNLLGGIGYFYGSSLVKSAYTGPEPVRMWNAPLFTATPSRPMFPRGFLWDEGFHGLVLARWDPELAMETTGHWLDLMNGEGWIAREQILGEDARTRVPSQFIVQDNTVANPPALMLTIEALMDSLPKLMSSEANRFRHWSALVLPRLHAWYQWLNRTQFGPVPLSYRWRGRNPKEIHQLNPLTFSSGFDDYPRASHPSDAERHLDLHCWMTLSARIIARLASFVAQYIQTETGHQRLQKLGEARTLAADYAHWAEMLSDQATMDKLYWSEKFGRYADYGLHTDAVRLRPPDRSPSQSPPDAPLEEPKLIRVADETPTLQLITSSFGYVNLFPLFLRLIPPNSPRLPRLISDLSDKSLLWSDHGLRSLSKNSPFYHRSNTKDDPPYWRGAIWLNINYLAVRSLRYYASHAHTPSNVAQLASQLSERLAQNLAKTVLGELERTGFLWEQYDDVTGRGQRAHPFTGWTSLISLILSD
ncbi:unnamed protein product [Calicophoron daubneyi]|uniref:Mannosyl-oligosaccharide glucosidase n=1 Tax=Calicophoron daubneyi TaxID=300641 RepID=A0AAV2TU83_CALDB